MSKDEKSRSSGQGTKFVPKIGKKKTARQYLDNINKNPEKFGTTKSHVDKVSSSRKTADKILEKNINGGKTVEKERTLKEGLVIRANGRLGVITQMNDLITVKFPTGSEKEYPTDKITFCRDQKKADKQYQEEIERRKSNG